MKKLLFLAIFVSSFVVLLKGSDNSRGNNLYFASSNQCNSDECQQLEEEEE